MKIKIIDNWEVELTNDRGDTLTLKGEWYADFFKEYENKQLIIANVVGRSEQLTCPRCKSTNILNPDRDNDAQCIECAFIWAG